MDRLFTHVSTWIGNTAGQPLTFLLAIGTVVVWAISGPAFDFSETWQLVINTGTTIVTFLMVFLIQNSQNRDTASMQAKLDELLYALDGAREKFIGIEHLTSREVEAVRAELEAEARASHAEVGHANGGKAAKRKRVGDNLRHLANKL